VRDSSEIGQQRDATLFARTTCDDPERVALRTTNGRGDAVPGLLVNGSEHRVEGLVIRNPRDAEWCRLSYKHFRPRTTSWIRQLIVHTTRSTAPTRALPGRGPGGGARRTLDTWCRGPATFAAHVLIDSDGTVACLCDLATTEAFHATVSNPWSVGIAMYQEPDGSIYESVYDAAIALIPTLCIQLGIQFQIPCLPHRNEPLRRMVDGGPDCVGIFGPRDIALRGSTDPGDEIFECLAAAGAESYDHNAGEDLEIWMGRQRTLNNHDGASLTIDGIPGPDTVAALKAAGHAIGIWAL
jgi:hypothetical protein